MLTEQEKNRLTDEDLTSLESLSEKGLTGDLLEAEARKILSDRQRKSPSRN